jgi:hypothetical protein
MEATVIGVELKGEQRKTTTLPQVQLFHSNRELPCEWPGEETELEDMFLLFICETLYNHMIKNERKKNI